MSAPEAAHAELDKALRSYFQAAGTDPGDVIVSWVAVAGVRRAEGGGAVLIEASDDFPPVWQLRGLLSEAQATWTETSCKPS